MRIIQLKFIVFAAIILIAGIKSKAVTDTLRHYNTVIGSKGYSYPHATYPKVYARFEPAAPGNITKVIVTLNGGTGSCKMHVFAHEGGGQLPGQQIDLISPVTVSKTATGIKKIVVNLATPVPVNNNQFFLKFENFSSGVALVTDTITHLNCTSQWGGDMYYQYLENGAGTPFIGNSAFAVDVIMDYTNGTNSPQRFQDISTSSGLGTGLSKTTVSWSDIDGDGFLDLLAAGKLFKNNKDNTFTNITTSAGINTPFFRNVFIDINNDGKDDMLFLSKTAADNAVYLNNGNSTFTKVALTFTTPAFDNISTISIADVNNDKYPDLFIGQLRDASSNPLPNYFYLNNKNNGFTDATSTFYPTAKLSETRGSQFVDFDNDGDLDLFVSQYRNEQDELWRNNGNGTFTDVCASKGIDKNANGTSNHGSGCDWADYDNDGDMDLLLPQLCHAANLAGGYSATTIYKNSGAPNYTFTKATSTGIQYEETHAGAHWGDVNADGLPDIFFSSFYTCRYSDLYEQQANNSFVLKSWDYGIHNVSGETDGTLVDMNNDGKLDLTCSDNGNKLRLFKNNVSNSNNYISIDLVSTSANHFAIGAKVLVQAGGKTYLQYQIPNHGALMNKSNRLFFGIGSASTVDKVTVSWPNGTVNQEEFTSGLTINSEITLTEGTGAVVTAVDQQVIGNFRAISVYPNPSDGDFTVAFSLTAPDDVIIQLFSVLGTKAGEFDLGSLDAGAHAIKWNAADLAGQSLPQGAYQYRIIGKSNSVAGTCMIMR